MLKLKELADYLNVLFSLNGVVDYCENGLQVEGKNSIFTVATAVSANLATLEQAALQNIDALIVHHGLFWQRDSYAIEGIKRDKLALLIKNDISLFAFHLPLDRHAEVGNNWKAARDLGWSDLEPFGYLNGVPIGVKGKISPCERSLFGKELEHYYCHPATSAYGGPQCVQTAALVSGGAHKTIVEATQNGIDAFVTGSFDEPTWHQAMEGKINFYALGHSATERVGPLALAKHLESKFSIPCHFIDIENPF